MGTNATWRIAAALLLLLGSSVLAGVLLLQHHGEPGAVAAVNQACGDGQTSGCEDVARSSWSSVAGIPVAAWGLAFYGSLCLALLLALAAPPEPRDALAALALAALALGLLVDVFLLGVQVVAIKAYCKLCIWTYLSSGLALVALLPARRSLSSLGANPARIESRLALTGWGLGSLAVAAAVLGWSGMLHERATQRQANLLGRVPAAAAAATSTAPVTLASAAPVASAPTTTTPAQIAAPQGTDGPAAAGPQDAKTWREQAEKLQATLDDPRKLEAYFSDKARREFEAATVVSIDLESVTARGPATAPVKVVAYSDFLCPFCRNLGLALTQFVPQAGGRLAVYFKNFPLETSCNPKLKQTLHPGACNLAFGAVCAQRQGKFDPYHDRVFASELRNPQPADVVRVASEAGLNAAAMQGCLDDPQTKEAVAAQVAEAQRLGVSSTPTVYVNGKKLPRINDFVATVDREAQKKGFKPLGQ